MRHVCCYSDVRLQMVHLRPALGGLVLFDALIGRESVFGTLYITIFPLYTIISINRSLASIFKEYPQKI